MIDKIRAIKQYFLAANSTAMANTSYEQYMQDTVFDWQDEIDGRKPSALSIAYRKLNRFYLWNLVDVLVRDATQAVVQTLWCRHKGHDFEDTGSWADPDSGGEDMTCKRCGYHFRHIYY